MPSVNSLLNTISDSALVGAGDAADTARMLRYLNLAYQEAYRDTATEYPQVLLTTEDVTITSGAGTISAAPFAVRVVKDTATNRILNAVTLEELEEKYPALNGTGAPSYYYMTSTTGISTYPVNSTTVRVRYVPQAATLVDGDAESVIKIPPAFHDMLVFGTLLYMAYDERDKGLSQEVQIAKQRYEESKASYKTWLMLHQPRERMRTKPVLA